MSDVDYQATLPYPCRWRLHSDFFGCTLFCFQKKKRMTAAKTIGFVNRHPWVPLFGQGQVCISAVNTAPTSTVKSFGMMMPVSDVKITVCPVGMMILNAFRSPCER